MKKPTLKQLLTGAAFLIVGLLLGWIFFASPRGNNHQGHQHETLAEVWTCSMHPQIRESEPGRCPLCAMELVPVSTLDQEQVADDEIQLSEAALKLAEVETFVVGQSGGEKKIYLPGKIEADERNIATVTAHFNGRVERLFADFTGQYISRGQRLATLYSPDLVTAQKELFEALKFRESNPSFYQAAIQKLKLWELTDSQIENIISTGEPQYNFNVYAPRSGTILSRKIAEGEHVMEGQVLFEIADLGKLWVVFNAYENDLRWINRGDSISFEVQSLPGQQFNSVITFVDPVVDNETRTTSIRTEVNNAQGQLKPEMFVEGTVSSSLNEGPQTLTIPKTAILWTGKRAVVYVKQPNKSIPTFQFREVVLGTEAGDFYTVSSGLSPGEEIAVNGVFKIDAAAQLQGKTSMMNPKSSQQDRENSARNPHKHSANSETESPEGNIQIALQEFYSGYLPIKNALVKSDLKVAKNEARKLLQNSPDHPDSFNDLHQHLNRIASSGGLSAARVALADLSDGIYKLLNEHQVETGAYRIFCPMAFDFKGAYWLSDSPEILNPYFGEEMLSCGTVEERLN